MKARSLFFAALAMVMAACVPTEGPNDVAPEFKVSGVKDNTISVGADKKNVTVSVTSNLSWSVECAAGWVTIDPKSYTAKEDKTSETVKVKVSVSANEVEEPREAELVFGAEGVDPVKVTLKQAAKEHEYKTITVFDLTEFAPVSDYSIEAPGLGGSVSFTVQANGDWTVEAPEWAVVTPASFTYTDNDLAEVTVAFGANLVEAREGEIRFKGNFEADLVVPVSQVTAPKVGVTYKSSSYCNVIMDVDVTDGTYWYVALADKENYDKMGSMGLGEWVVSNVQALADKYSAHYTASQVVELTADGRSSAENYDYNELDPETEYYLVVVPVTVDDTTIKLAGIPSDAITFTTTAEPTATGDYVSILGTYVNSAYDYFSSDDEHDVFNDLKMVVEPYIINESVLISFTDDNYFPLGVDEETGEVFADPFVGKYSEGKLSIEVPQVSRYGAFWNFNGLGAGAIDLEVFYLQSETVEVETWDLTVNGGNLVASASPASDVEGDPIVIQSAILCPNEYGILLESGKATGIAIILDPTFTKVVEEEVPASTKAVSPKGLSFKNANKPLETITRVHIAK